MERIIIDIEDENKREMLVKILDAIGITYTDPNNPSPSGDKWFLEPENLKLIEQGIEDVKAGRVKRIKDINNIWESIL